MNVLNRVRILAFVAGGLVSFTHATELTVGAGETVAYTASDAAVVASLTKITFADAAGRVTLTGAADFALAANVAGAGKIVATDATSLTLSGDCRGFTGGWEFQNAPVTVTSRYGFGDATTLGGVSSGGLDYGVYIHDTALTTPLVFSGNGLTNDVSVYLYQCGASSRLNFNFGGTGTWVQNGEVKLYKCAYLYFGDATFNATFRQLSQAFHWINSGSRVVFNAQSYFPCIWWYRTNGTSKPSYLEFNATDNIITSELNSDNSVRVFFGADNVTHNSQELMYLMNGNVLDLQGHDQAFSVLAYKNTTASSSLTASTITSDVPATVTISGGAYDKATTTRAMASAFRGKTSLTFASPATYNYAKAQSVTEGSLAVQAGTFVIGWDAGWGGTNVTVTGGNLVLNSANSLKDDTADLVITGGKLTIGSGVTAFVSAARIAGVTIDEGSYTVAALKAAYPAVSDYVDGDGSLAVAQNQPEVEVVCDTWTGAAAPNTLLTTAGNWKDLTAPNLADGGADLTFSEGTDLATVNTDASAIGLHFNLAKSFTLAKLTGKTLALGKRGLSVTNASDGAVSRTIATVEADIVNSLSKPGNVTIGPDALLYLKGKFTGGSGASTITVKGQGEVILEGDNAALAAKLAVLVDGNSSVPFVLRVRSATALGAANRTTTIECPGIRFECLTNDTPICARSYGMGNPTYDGDQNYKRLTESGRTLVLNGLMSSYSNICGGWNLSGVTLRGGFRDNGGYMAFRAEPGTVARLASAVDAMPDWDWGKALLLVDGGTFEFGAAEHKYYRVLLDAYSGNSPTLVCTAPNALLAARPFCFIAQKGAVGTLDLNGCDQEVAFLSQCNGNDQTITPADLSATDYGTVTSETAATLTLNGSIDEYQAVKNSSPKTYYAHPTNAVVKFTGLAGLHFAGATADAYQILSYAKSDSQGDLHVSAGTLAFKLGAGWSGAQKVLIDGTGTIEADAASAPVLFGAKKGASQAELRIGGNGRLSIPSGTQITVWKLKIGDTDEAVFRTPGVYGGPEAGLDKFHTLPCLTGGGTVLAKRGSPGLIVYLD